MFLQVADKGLQVADVLCCLQVADNGLQVADLVNGQPEEARKKKWLRHYGLRFTAHASSRACAIGPARMTRWSSMGHSISGLIKPRPFCKYFITTATQFLQTNRTNGKQRLLITILLL